MADIIMAAGKEGRRYSQRGARAAARINGRHQRLLRVDGEVYTYTQVKDRLPWPEKQLMWHLDKLRKRGEVLTWEKLHNLNIKLPEAPSV